MAGCQRVRRLPDAGEDTARSRAHPDHPGETSPGGAAPGAAESVPEDGQRRAPPSPGTARSSAGAAKEETDGAHAGHNITRVAELDRRQPPIRQGAQDRVLQHLLHQGQLQHHRGQLPREDQGRRASRPHPSRHDAPARARRGSKLPVAAATAAAAAAAAAVPRGHGGRKPAQARLARGGAGGPAGLGAPDGRGRRGEPLPGARHGAAARGRHALPWGGAHAGGHGGRAGGAAADVGAAGGARGGHGAGAGCEGCRGEGGVRESDFDRESGGCHSAQSRQVLALNPQPSTLNPPPRHPTL
ncbi:hypothetical protein T484DRAFT_3023933 [Baffinella frigidus]|nr:hypothetical protein T484DRAFT_3023933 [Cryptophyta sp. CCMP2293]